MTQEIKISTGGIQIYTAQQLTIELCPITHILLKQSYFRHQKRTCIVGCDYAVLQNLQILQDSDPRFSHGVPEGYTTACTEE